MVSQFTITETVKQQKRVEQEQIPYQPTNKPSGTSAFSKLATIYLGGGLIMNVS